MIHEDGSGRRRAVPVRWHFPPDLPTVYATNVIAQHTAEEFILSFFLLTPPIILGTTEERQEQAETLPEVTATAVARVVLSPAKLEEMIEVLRTNLTSFENRQGQEEE